MGKAQKSNREEKKAPVKSIKEKRAEKSLKKDGKAGTGNPIIPKS